MNRSAKQDIAQLLGIFVFFLLLALVVFRCAWGSDNIFSGSDFNIGIIASIKRNLPEGLFGGYYRSTPVLGSVSSAVPAMYNIACWLLPPALCSSTLYGMYLVASSMCLAAYLRLFMLRRVSCVVGAVSAFWVGSITMSASGHVAKLGVMALFSAALYLLEKSLRAERTRSRLMASSGGGLTVGMMLLEQQDVGLLAGMFLGFYVLFRLVQMHRKSWRTWIGVLLPVALLGIAVAGPTALKAYSVNVTQTGIGSDGQDQWDFITQWSMVPAEVPDLVAPGYSGWSTGNPEGPYWGQCGQSAEWKTTGAGFPNFRLDSSYIGMIPLLLGGLGVFFAFRSRKKDGERCAVTICWAALGLLALLLAFGKFSPLYRLFYHLPLVGNIRAPIKFLHNFQVIIGILAAFGADAMLRTVEGKDRTGLRFAWMAAAGLAFVALLLALSAQSTGFEQRFSEWGTHASTIVANISAAWFHAAWMAGIFGAAAFLATRTFPYRGMLIALLLVGAVAFDSVFITSRYFKAVDFSALRDSNDVIRFLKNSQDMDRIFFLDQSGVYNSWLAQDVPYHGLNVFNIWQMPRMPAEYKTFLGAAGRNPYRLWQLASIRFITAPAAFPEQLGESLREHFEPVMYYRFVRQGQGVGVQALPAPASPQDQVLLRFDAALPRFALFRQWEQMPLDAHCDHLFSGQFDPMQYVLVEEGSAVPPSAGSGACRPLTAEASMNNAILQTDSDAPGILLFTQRFQPEWQVSIDDRPAELLRCNFLCMGVLVPAGKHTVRFECR